MYREHLHQNMSTNTWLWWPNIENELHKSNGSMMTIPQSMQGWGDMSYIYGFTYGPMLCQ